MLGRSLATAVQNDGDAHEGNAGDEVHRHDAGLT
jgi:hypothetical protein